MSQDIYNDFVTATHGAPTSQEGAWPKLKDAAPGVASLVQLYKEVEKQTGQPLVGNPAKSAVYDALDHAAHALAEAAYARKPEEVDVTAAAKYLNDSPGPTAIGVLERVSAAGCGRISGT